VNVRRLSVFAVLGVISAVARAIPPEYAGDWICQTALPGYSVRPPHADPSQPLTDKLTTPPLVQILKFSLSANGTYESTGSKGRYAFDAATNSITWLDGPHAPTFSKTQIGRRDNGAPKMSFVANKRYYGCFKPAVR
jgi:hypothetical protein